MMHILTTPDETISSDSYIKVLGGLKNNNARVVLLLQLLDLDFYLFKIDITKQENRAEWFGKINPAHKVPVVEIKEAGAEPFYLCESAAIMLYLCEKYDTERKYSYAISDSLYWDQTQELFWSFSELLPIINALHYLVTGGPGLEASIGIFVGQFRERSGVLEHKLATRGGWVVGGKFTIVDLALYAILSAPELRPFFDFTVVPYIGKWLDAIKTIVE